MNIEDVIIEVGSWVVALEDKRFFLHSGVDYLAVIRAFAMYLIGRAHGGASTIEMQLWRTITGRKERTLFRKIEELLAARKISQKMNKLDILDTYCDIAFASAEHFSMYSCIMAFPEDQREFQNKALFVACLLKYPLPKTRSEEWARKIRTRYRYGLTREKTMMRSAQRIRELIKRRRDLSNS